MIGRVHFVEGETDLIATLGKNGKWKCSDARWEIELNLFYDPTRDENRSPAYGGFGHRPLRMAARYLSGRVEFAPTENDPDKVY